MLWLRVWLLQKVSLEQLLLPPPAACMLCNSSSCNACSNCVAAQLPPGVAPSVPQAAAAAPQPPQLPQRFAAGQGGEVVAVSVARTDFCLTSLERVLAQGGKDAAAIHELRGQARALEEGAVLARMTAAEKVGGWQWIYMSGSGWVSGSGYI